MFVYVRHRQPQCASGPFFTVITETEVESLAAWEQLIADVPKLEDGGTLAVLMGCDALRRDYTAKLYTYNLPVFDLKTVETVINEMSAFPLTG